MNILQKRIANVKRNGREYCISRIYIDGTYECDAIEDYDRGLSQSMSVQEIKSRKIASRTAIPIGDYTITMQIKSPKFSQKEYYRAFCKGYLPRFLDVKGYEGVLIHCGTNEESSAGCIIVGQNKIVGAVINSKQCFERLYNKLLSASQRGEKLNYSIVRTY